MIFASGVCAALRKLHIGPLQHPDNRRRSWLLWPNVDVSVKNSFLPSDLAGGKSGSSYYNTRLFDP